MYPPIQRRTFIPSIRRNGPGTRTRNREALPHFLVESFKSTLEEVIHASCLLHVIDGSAYDIDVKIASVEKVIFEELKLNNCEIINIINKILLSQDKPNIKDVVQYLKNIKT